MERLKSITKDYIWGGRKLKQLFHKEGGDRVAESWEVSVHPDGESRIGNGKTLSEYLHENPQAVFPDGGDFPVLIKFIDAAEKLSVQVHPGDSYARRVEADNGKTEMWYIIDAEKGAGIYCGLRRNTDKEEVKRKIEDGTIEELLNFIPVKAGESYLIEAGTLHAIGAGCLICEVQESSNVTYRVYDYKRKGTDGKLRPLHIEKALEVMNFQKFDNRTNGGDFQSVGTSKIRRLTSCEYFTCRELVLSGRYEEKNDESFTAICIVAGSGEIGGESFAAGDSFFIPRGEKFSLNGNARAVITSAMKQKYYAGIDLGGTFIKCGIVSSTGALIATKKCSTPGTAEETIETAAQLVLDLSRETGKEIRGVGVGCPGQIDSGRGLVVYSNNLGWKNVFLRKALERRLSLPVRITNDANAAALGEYYYGAGSRLRSMVMLTLGTGVGSGIVLDGKLFEGNRGAGAEIGHEVIRARGERCTCGRRGCLEAYASASALIRNTERAMDKDPQSELWKLCDGKTENVTGKTPFDGLRLGDKTAERVVKDYIGYLAEGVVNAMNIFRPDAVVIGGGISAEGDTLIQPLRRLVARRVFGGQKYAPVQILAATLKNDAGIYGAASLVMETENGGISSPIYP